MNDQTVTLVVGLAGILGTVISSGLGLYFVARARTAPLREQLYLKQVDIVLDIIDAYARARNFVVLVSDSASQHRDRAFDDLTEMMPHLNKLEAKAAAILPTELYLEAAHVNTALHEIIAGIEANTDTAQFVDTFHAHRTKTALISRIVLGVDELSDDTVRLLGRAKNFKDVAAMPAKALLNLRDKNDSH